MGVMATRATTALLALLPALWPASPVFAVVHSGKTAPAGISVRVVPAGQSLLSAPALSLTPVSVLTAGAPVLAPAPALVAAPAAAPDAPKLPFSDERSAQVLELLAPEAAARVPGEEAKSLSGELLGEGAARRSGGDVVLGGVSEAPRLAPAGAAYAAASDAPAAPSSARRVPTLRERLHYWKLLTGSFTWYMTTNVANKWRSHRAQLLKARAEGPVSVTRQREFFAAMRTTGMSGHFYVLGGSALEDHEVIEDMRAAFARYFNHPGVGSTERDSYENFMARARLYKAGRRSHTYLYKTIRDAMLKASLLPPSKLAAFFDAQIAEGMQREALDFQNKGEQKRVADAFREALLAVLDREDPRARNRVLAAVVLGSFASGAAGPGSDFDVELVTANGSDDRVKAFSDAIVAEWSARGGHQKHPVTVHDHAARPSRASLDLVHSADYFIVTRSPLLHEELSRAPGEGPAFTVDRARTVRGRLGILLQGTIVRASILAEDLKAVLR